MIADRIKISSMMFFLFFILVHIASAAPSLPTEFYGEVYSYGQPAPTNSVITAITPDNETCGSFTIRNGGYYGSLSCMGYDNYTDSSNSSKNGDHISFHFNGEKTTSFGNNVFESGSFRNVELVHPNIICGDGFCDPNYEECGVCNSDCGSCPGDDDTSQPEEITTGGPQEGGTTAGGAGGSAGGQTTAVSPNCKEEWDCGDWSACGDNSLQKRTCSDNNKCGTTNSRPTLTQSCTRGNCTDGIKNNNETGIDCGGPCIECVNESIAPIVETPADMSGCNPYSKFTDFRFYFMLLTFMVLGTISIGYIERRADKLLKDKRLLDSLRLGRLHNLKLTKEAIVFSIAAILSVLLELTFSCFSLTTIIFNFAIILLSLMMFDRLFKKFQEKYLSSSEGHSPKKIAFGFLDIVSVMSGVNMKLKISNLKISLLSKEIDKSLAKMEKKNELAAMKAKLPELVKIGDSLHELLDSYKENSKPTKIEKKLISEMSQLLANPNFNELLKGNLQLRIIAMCIKAIIAIFGAKQKIYDMISKKRDLKIETIIDVDKIEKMILGEYVHIFEESEGTLKSIEEKLENITSKKDKEDGLNDRRIRDVDDRITQTMVMYSIMNKLFPGLAQKTFANNPNVTITGAHDIKITKKPAGVKTETTQRPDGWKETYTEKEDDKSKSLKIDVENPDAPKPKPAGPELTDEEKKLLEADVKSLEPQQKFRRLKLEKKIKESGAQTAEAPAQEPANEEPAPAAKSTTPTESKGPELTDEEKKLLEADVKSLEPQQKFRRLKLEKKIKEAGGSSAPAEPAKEEPPKAPEPEPKPTPQAPSPAPEPVKEEPKAPAPAEPPKEEPKPAEAPPAEEKKGLELTDEQKKLLEADLKSLDARQKFKRFQLEKKIRESK